MPESKRNRYAGLFERLMANSVESEQYAFEGTPCWEWMGYRIRRGYGRVSMRLPGKAKPQGIAAHRAMAALLVLERELHPDRETVEHRCELPWCINYLHFALATRAENTSDMRARRSGRPRKQFRPLLDLRLFSVDPFVRCLPVRRDRVPVVSECPF